jgi:hypothetical protein
VLRIDDSGDGRAREHGRAVPTAPEGLGMIAKVSRSARRGKSADPGDAAATRSTPRTGGGGFSAWGGAETEAAEDPGDRQLVGDEGDRTHALAAAGADERVDLADLGDQPHRGG